MLRHTFFAFILLSRTVLNISSVKAVPVLSTQDLFFNGSITSGCILNRKTDADIVRLTKKGAKRRGIVNT